MTPAAPPIVQLAARVLLELEEIVRGFPRYHKYAVGAELRLHARTVSRCAHRAWRDQGYRAQWVRRLVFAVDDLKFTIQLAKDVRAFKSFAQFESLVRIVSDLGRQCGGWQKQLRRSYGQNRAGSAQPGRAEILSARSASPEAPV
jgi:hypothetical protein